MRINRPHAVGLYRIEAGMRSERVSKFISCRQPKAIALETKFGSVPECPAENIVILDPAPKVPIRHVIDLFKLSCVNANDRREHISFRANNSVPKQVRVSEREVAR
jgi:hypothetical protein